MGNTSLPEPPPLSRQGSFLGLTLDEIQNQLGNHGNPLGSMNLDELLKTVWTGEAVDTGASLPAQLAPGSPFNRPSSFSLSRDLSKRTLEEVWRQIQQENRKKNDGELNQERRNTLGQMTLEDFLAQAGVAVESGGRSNSNAQWIQQQVLLQHQPISASRAPMVGSAYLETSVSPSALMMTLSDIQAPGRKRVGPGDEVAKTVERRQKRMIKNRESAARSRARKQAYTNELENKVSQLEEENERLRRLKEAEKVLLCAPPPKPKHRLHRTSSAPF